MAVRLLSYLLRRGHWAEVFSPVQQARPYAFPELEPLVWAASDQAGENLGQAEPWCLSLSSPKSRAGHGSQLSHGFPPRTVPRQCKTR